MGKPRHRDQDHTERLGGDGAGSLVGFLCPCRAAVCIMLFILSILIYCLCSRLSTMQECGGCLPVPGPASSQAAHLPGQAAHRQGDRDGEDEEDGGFAAGAKPGRGREDSWCSVVSGWGGGGVGGSLNGDKVLRAGVGTWSFQSGQWLLLCKWKSRIKLPQSQPSACPSAFRAAHPRWGKRAQKAHLFSGIVERNAHSELKL